eukprot:sb/3466072/
MPALLLFILATQAWSPVDRGTKIPFDLESTPLQIKTRSGDQIKMYIILNAQDKSIGNSMVLFTSPIQYFIGYCTSSWTEFPVQPPDEVDKIWTIQKTATAFIIECNGVEVLNHQFSDSSDSQLVCPGFTVDGSVQGIWNDTDPGQIVTINCQKKHVRDGSSERTCTADGVWNIDPPLCMKQAWNPVVGGTDIPFDLESTPLQIKTDSTTGSKDRILVNTFTAAGSKIGPVLVYSTSSATVPAGPSSQYNQERKWTSCVLHLKYPKQHHFYPSVCPGFTVTGSLQGSWDDTDPGQTVTINCQKKYVRDGSSERTCTAYGVWDDEAPLCMKLIINSTHRSPGRVDFLDLCVGGYRTVAG